MNSTTDSKADFRVHEFRTLGRNRDAEALSLLRQVAHQVQPIMIRREWSVPLLSEFFPAQTNLLGLNVGGGGGRTCEVKVRLRPARDPDSFLSYESVLHTMLHELVHNVRGPHDKVFYKLLDEITAECEELMAKGVGGTGTGFDGPSCGRLGSHSFIPQHNPHPASLRDVALRAAEERAKRQRIMPTGPQRLGGGARGGEGGPPRYANPAAAAAAAAERRCKDNRWCPCERVANALGRAAAAAQQIRVEQRQEQHERQRPSHLGSVSVPGAASGCKGVPTGAGGVTSGNGQGLSSAPGLKSTRVESGSAASAGLGCSTNSRSGHSRSVTNEGASGLDLAGVEADLVRRIEDGILDLTLDSDSEPECEPCTTNDVGGNRQAARGHGQAAASAAGVSGGGESDGIRGGRGNRSGNTGAVQRRAEGGSAVSAAVGLTDTPGWSGPGPGLEPGLVPGPEGRANQVVVVIIDSDQEGDPHDSGHSTAAETSTAPAAARAPATARARCRNGVGLEASMHQHAFRVAAAASRLPADGGMQHNAMPAPRAGAAGPVEAAGQAAKIAAQARPPLLVLQPRTAAAACAATAAMARLQPSAQQSAQQSANPLTYTLATTDSNGRSPVQTRPHEPRSLYTSTVDVGAIIDGSRTLACTSAATVKASGTPSPTGAGHGLSMAQKATGASQMQQPLTDDGIIDLTEDG